MWQLVMTTLLPGFVFGFLLNVFYVAVKHVWPANYFGLSSTVDPIISRNLTRYLIFRFVPPALAVAAAAVTSDRNDGSPWLATIIVLIVHCRKIVRAVRGSIGDGLYTFAGGQFIVMLIIISIGIGVTAVRDLIAPAIPEPTDLLSNLWAGLVAAIGAVYLQQIVLVKRGPLAIAKQVAAKISPDLLRYTAEQARVAGVDDSIVYAVMIAEDIQRPMWFRWLEYRFPGPRKRRTMGIMQQPGASSDVRSVDQAIADYLVPATKEQGAEGSREVLERVLQRYTQNAEFRGLITGIFDEIETDPVWLSDLRTGRTGHLTEHPPRH